MLQTKIRMIIMSGLLIGGFSVFSWCQSNKSNGTKASKPNSQQALACTLTHIPDTETFNLRFKNQARYNLAVIKHPHLYEVRVFDTSGKKITNMKRIMELKKSGRVTDDDWVVLKPGESISLSLRAYGLLKRDGKIEVSGMRADCVRYTRMRHDGIPKFVKKAHAKFIEFKGTPSIAL